MKTIEQKDPPDEVSGGATTPLDHVDAFIFPPAPVISPFPKEPISPVQPD